MRKYIGVVLAIGAVPCTVWLWAHRPIDSILGQMERGDAWMLLPWAFWVGMLLAAVAFLGGVYLFFSPKFLWLFLNFGLR